MNKIVNVIRTKYKIILIIVSIILIVNIILMVYLFYRYNHREEYVERPVTIISKNEFTFGNWGEILGAIRVTESNSKKLTASKVGKAIETFATSFIPYINENVLKNNSTTPEKFFDENKNYIFQYSGISEKKDFITLCNDLKNADCNINELANAYYIEDTAQYRNDIFRVDVKISDNDEKTINIRVTTDEKTKNRFKYEILK